MIDVLVLGGGVAGLAAAVAARDARPAASVQLVVGLPGATSLSTGVVDRAPWDVLRAGLRAADLPATTLGAPGLAEDARAFLAALGLHAEPGAVRSLVATTGGVVRTAEAPTRTQLDLARIEGRTVLLPAADRAAWDADSLVRSLADNPYGVRFDTSAAVLLRFADESTIADVDLARRHDAEDRARWLATQLGRERARRGDGIAFLLGPWLGVNADVRAALERDVGCPVGEIASPHANVFGARFEPARSRLCEERGVSTRAGWAKRIERTSEGDFEVHVGEEVLRARTIVLAVGGLVGGGLAYQPPLFEAEADGATRMSATFLLSIDGIGNSIAARHERALVGSTEGPVLDQTAWPRGTLPGALERAGVSTDASGALPRMPGVYAAGDAVASRDRTLGVAIETGLAAGRAAALAGAAVA